MTAITLNDLKSMQDEDERDNLVFDLLQLFEVGGPLQKEVLMRWKVRRRVKAEYIKQAVELALKNGWIVGDSAGVHLTHEGREKRTDTMPSHLKE
jgi:hypothetical protein